MNLIKKALPWLFRPSINTAQWSGQTFSAAPNTPLVITPDTALQFSAVYACTRIISTNIASLPLDIYTRTNKGKDLDTASPYNRLLKFSPTKRMSSFDWLQAVVSQMLLFGNSYSVISRTGKTITDLFLLRPDRMNVKADASGVVYEYQDGSQRTVYQPSQILHFKNVSLDGVVGLSTVSLMRQSIGLGLQSETYASNIYRNNGRPGGLLINKAGVMTPEQHKRIAESWAAQVAGDRVGGTAIIESDMDYRPLNMSLADAQFLGTVQLSVATVARAFGVPLFMLMAEDAPTYAGLAEASRTFHSITLRPLLVAIETTLNNALFGFPTKGFVEFDASQFLRTDPESRFKGYALAVQNGINTRNEIRELESWNRIDDPMADTLTIQGKAEPTGQR